MRIQELELRLIAMGLPEINGYYYTFDYKLTISVYHKINEVKINSNGGSGKFYTPVNALAFIQDFIMGTIDPPIQHYYWKILGRKVKVPATPSL